MTWWRWFPLAFEGKIRRWPSWFPASDVPGESSKELHRTEGLAVSCALYGGCEGQEEQEREGRSGVCNWFITYRCGGGFILLWETVFCFRFFFVLTTATGATSRRWSISSSWNRAQIAKGEGSQDMLHSRCREIYECEAVPENLIFNNLSVVTPLIRSWLISLVVSFGVANFDCLMFG